MATVKPFKGYRPVKELAGRIASRPYDVLNSSEARQEAAGNPYSFLHVVKPEIDLPEDVDHYSDIVYETGRKTLLRMISEGILFQDNEPCYYIYSQTMWNKTQYGLVGCASVEDYVDGKIKKHELTRPDKEEDRKNHIRVTNFNAEPVFFTYPDNAGIDQIVNRFISNKPEYDFTTSDGVGHALWIINNREDVSRIEDIFSNEIPFTYIADGHHRTAAAAHVGEEKKKNNSHHKGNEEYNYFLAVHFPASQLTIINYNRVVKDLNGLSEEAFISKISESYRVKKIGADIYKPTRFMNFQCISIRTGMLLKQNQGHLTILIRLVASM